MRCFGKEIKITRGVRILVVALAGAMIWTACGAKEDQDQGRTTWQVTGCSQALSDNLNSSQECSPDQLVPAGQDPCREKLFWKYDSLSKVLQIVDFSIPHTCCAKLSLKTDVSSAGVVLDEFDAPPRCLCQCQSNLSTCLSGIEPGALPLSVRRTQTDASNGPKVFFDGKLNLAEGAGVIDLGPSPSPECVNQ